MTKSNLEAPIFQTLTLLFSCTAAVPSLINGRNHEVSELAPMPPRSLTQARRCYMEA